MPDARCRRRKHGFQRTICVVGPWKASCGKQIDNYSQLLGDFGGSVLKNLPANSGDTDLIPWLERSLGEGNGNPFQHSCLENPRDGGAWWAAVYGVAQSRTRLSASAAAAAGASILVSIVAAAIFVPETVLRGSLWSSS